MRNTNNGICSMTGKVHNWNKNPSRQRARKARYACTDCSRLGPWTVMLDSDGAPSKAKALDTKMTEHNAQAAVLAMTVPELRERAKSLGIVGYSKMNKATLVDEVSAKV